jgi:hypothetical protein
MLPRQRGANFIAVNILPANSYYSIFCEGFVIYRHL